MKKICLYGFYPLWMMEYFIMMFGVNLNKIIGLPLMVLLSYYALKKIFHSTKQQEKLVIFFIGYCLMTGFFTALRPVPFDGFTVYIKYFVFPIFFYFFGSDEEDKSDKFYKYFGGACTICFIIGFYLHFVAPSFYTSFILKYKMEAYYIEGASLYDEDTIMSVTNFASFLGSVYYTSLLSIPTLVISYCLLFRKNNISEIWFHIAGFSSLLASILCFQRISIFFGILYFLFFCIYGFFYRKKSISIIGGGLFIIVTVIFVNKFQGSHEWFFDSIMKTQESFSFTDAMSRGRSKQYENVFSIWDSPFLGNGLGSASSVARQYGFKGVTDGEYVRILVETGIIGFSLFVFIVVSSFLKAYKELKYYLMEFLVILFYLGACVGANALSLHTIIAPIFWYSLGRVYNNNYLSRLKQQKE